MHSAVSVSEKLTTTLQSVRVGVVQLRVAPRGLITSQPEPSMKHCLIVDDSEVIRKVARRILESMQFEILEAENGQQAIEICKKQMPDAILLDWHMPVMGGVEFLGALRLANLEKRPYVLYATTENDQSELSRAFTAGADDYVLKPFDTESLEAKLADAGLTN